MLVVFFVLFLLSIFFYTLPKQCSKIFQVCYCCSCQCCYFCCCWTTLLLLNNTILWKTKWGDGTKKSPKLQWRLSKNPHTSQSSSRPIWHLLESCCFGHIPLKYFGWILTLAETHKIKVYSYGTHMKIIVQLVHTEYTYIQILIFIYYIHIKTLIIIYKYMHGFKKKRCGKFFLWKIKTTTQLPHGHVVIYHTEKNYHTD